MGLTIVKRFSRLWSLGNLMCSRSNSLPDDRQDSADMRLEGALRGWKANDKFADSCVSKDDSHGLTHRSSWNSLRRSLSDDLQLLAESLEMSEDSSDADDLSSRDHYVPGPGPGPVHCIPKGDGDADRVNDTYKAVSGLESLTDNLLVFILRNIGDTLTLFRCSMVSRRLRQLVQLALKDMHQLSFTKVTGDHVTGYHVTGDQVAKALRWTRHLGRLSLKYEADSDVISPKSILPVIQTIWLQNGTAAESSLKRRGRHDQDEAMQTLTLDSLQLWLSGQASWKFYQSVASLAMVYAKMVRASGKRVITFSLRIGSGDSAAALEPQRPPDQGNLLLSQKGTTCGATKSAAKAQGVSWIGYVSVGLQAAANREGFEAASRDLKLLMAPRLFKLACLHRSSARNRGWTPPPVVFEIEFGHTPSSTPPIEHGPAHDAVEKKINHSDGDDDNKSGSRVDSEDKGGAVSPAPDELTTELCESCDRGQKKEEEEESCSVSNRCTDITECLISLLDHIIDEHPGE